MNERKGYQGGIVWPLVLIGAGVILLLNNLGVSDINLWEVALRLWPALLIGFGIELLIPRRSLWGTLAAFLAVIAVLVASYWLMTFDQVRSSSLYEFNQPRQGASRAEITIDQAVGELDITTVSAGSSLVSGTIQSGERFQPETNFTQSGSAARFELMDSARQFGPFPVYMGTRRWDVGLSEGLPLDLKLHQGVGLARLELAQAELTSFNGDFGVGRLVLKLPAGDLSEVKIDGGVGEVMLVLPAGEVYEIQLDRGLSTLQYPASFRLDGSVLRSRQPGENETPIVITIDMGVGSIRIVED